MSEKLSLGKKGLSEATVMGTVWVLAGVLPQSRA